MADYKMKAWRGVNVYEGYAVIVFAETRGKAKVEVMHSDGFEDTDFVDIVVYREPKADKVYDGRKELDWYNTIDRIFMVRELGFYCSDDVFDFEDCKECAARYYCDKYKEYVEELN